MIDANGFRANVGIILCNDAGRLFWARRVGMDAWQFPQGGIKRHESPEAAMYRELHEEVGLQASQVEIIGQTRRWLRYRLPERFVRTNRHPVCIGQKQKWFAVRLIGDDSLVDLNRVERPEFDDWRWVSYWRPVRDVVAFKRNVYRKALTELAPALRPLAWMRPGAARKPSRCQG